MKRIETYCEVDGGIKANCSAKAAVRLAQELQIQSGSTKDNHIEMIASIGTGVIDPNHPNSKKADIYWNQHQVNLSADSEKMRQEGMLEDKHLDKVPKIR
eukprot:716089-Ditylum_brightwellii.AAC.1